MALRKAKKSGGEEGLPSEFKELVDLVVTYAKQQTLDPLKRLGRWVGFGVVGALLLGVGVALLGLGLLRAVQTEAGKHLRGNWSWVPYLVVVAFYAVVLALVVGAMTRSSGTGTEEP